jgi:hypothetical protein
MDHIVQRFDMLHIDGGDDVDPRREHVLHILPALVMGRAGHIAMGELVDQRNRRMPLQNREQIHLFEYLAAVYHLTARHRLQTLGLVRGGLAAVRLQIGDGDVLALILQTVTLAQHRVRFAHSRSGADQHLQRASGDLGHIDSFPTMRSIRRPHYPKRSSAALSSRTFTPSSPIKPRPRWGGASCDERVDRIHAQITRLGHPVDLDIGIRHTDLIIKSRSGRRDGIGGDLAQANMFAPGHFDPPLPDQRNLSGVERPKV